MILKHSNVLASHTIYNSYVHESFNLLQIEKLHQMVSYCYVTGRLKSNGTDQDADDVDS